MEKEIKRQIRKHRIGHFLNIFGLLESIILMIIAGYIKFGVINNSSGELTAQVIGIQTPLMGISITLLLAGLATFILAIVMLVYHVNKKDNLKIKLKQIGGGKIKNGRK